MVSKEMDESLLIGEAQYKDEKRWHQEGQHHSQVLGLSFQNWGDLGVARNW